MLEIIGSNIRYYRRKAGITQVELSKMLGYRNYTSISKIESGQNDVPLSVLARMAEILGVNPGDFFDTPEERYYDYLPYIRRMEQNDPEKLRIIREMLGMPSKKICDSIEKIV